MSRNAAQVLLGPGYFYTAPYGEAFPSFGISDTIATLPGGNWVEAGCKTAE